MTDLDRLLSDNGLVASVVPADANPTMPDPPPGMSHWAVLLEGGSEPVAWHVSTLGEDGETVPPTVSEAVGFLQADLRGLAQASDPEAWIAGLSEGTSDPAAWANALSYMRQVSEEVSSRLPQAVAGELTGQAGAPSPALQGP